MKDLQAEAQVNEAETGHSAAYLQAVAQLAAERRRQEQSGYAVGVLLMGLGDDGDGPRKEARIVAWARNFCILFAFVVPNILLYITVF